MKPAFKPQTHEKYNRLIEAAAAAGPVVTAVAHPCDEASLKGAVEAARLQSHHASAHRAPPRGSRRSRLGTESTSAASEPWTRCTAMIRRPRPSNLCATAKPRP